LKKKENRPKNFEDITEKYHRFTEDLKAKKSKYREALPDDKCRTIYDILFREAETKNIDTFRFKELCQLTGMNKVTLGEHLNHLEEKRFLTKKSESKYKTSYKVNLIKNISVCKITKNIFGKEKLELADIRKIGVGDSFIPMEPMKTVKPSEKDEDLHSSSEKKSKVHFKAHKNK
jgi:hypothetical protein